MVKFTGKIEKIITETIDVKTFVIQTPCAFEFTPGQFVMLSFEKDGKSYGPNAFTISSAPLNKDHKGDCSISLTVKKVKEFTSALFELEEWDFVECSGPFGNNLNFDTSIKDEVAFVAIGVAITPFMSSLEYAIKNNMSQKFSLIYGSKTRDDMIFRKRILEIAEKYPNISLYNFFSNEECELMDDDYAGRIPLDEITTLVDDPNKTQWFICGSTQFNNDAADALENKNVPTENIHVESRVKSKK